ncbi:MAG: hypothetical protein AABO41_09525 [Acidobacteriota bacterium]
MKRRVIISALIIICLTATPAALGQSYDVKKDAVQKGCEFSPLGTWKAATPNEKTPILYRFTPDAKLTVLSGSGQSSELREVASAGYVLDNPKAPKVILVKADKEGGGFAQGITAMDITGYDDTSLTFVKPGSTPTRWVRVDPYRYFMVLAGRIGTFYDGSGPTFPILIKTDGQQTQIDAVGTYTARPGYWAFGTIPPETYNEFMKEPRKDMDVMLRLEITLAQYERGLKIVKTWERRARNNELLYQDLTMNNILVAKQVTETLNQCGERFKLHKLDWSMEDHISSSSPLDSPPISRIPFLYFKELRRLNESLHVGDEKFHAASRLVASPPGR